MGTLLLGLIKAAKFAEHFVGPQRLRQVCPGQCRR
jgi:hypothetical protein